MGAFEAEPVTHTVKVGELDCTPLGVALDGGEPLLLISAVSEGHGVAIAVEQALNVSLRVPAATVGLGEALVVELREEVAQALGVEVPCGEKVPSACEALGDPDGVGVAVARQAEALTLTERRGVSVGDNDTLGLPDGDGDCAKEAVGRGEPVAGAEPVAWTAEPEGDPDTLQDCVFSGVTDTLTVDVPNGDSDCEVEPETRTEKEAHGVLLPLALRASVADGVGDEHAVRLRDALPVAIALLQWVAVTVIVSLPEDVKEREVQPEADGEAVDERDGDGDAVAHGEGEVSVDAEGLPEGELVTVHDAVVTADPLDVRDRSGVAVPLTETRPEREALTQPLLERLAEGQGDGVALTQNEAVEEPQAVAVALASGERDALGEDEEERDTDTQPEGEGDCVCEGDPVPQADVVEVPAGENEPLAVAQTVVDKDAHADKDDDWVGETEPVAQIDSLGLTDTVAQPEGECDVEDEVEGQPLGLHVDEPTAVEEGDGESVSLPDGERDALPHADGDDDCEGDVDTEGGGEKDRVALPQGVDEEETETVTEPIGEREALVVPHTLVVTVQLAVSRVEAVGDAVGDGEEEAHKVADVVAVAKPVGEAHAEFEMEGVAVPQGELELETVTHTDADSESVGENDADGEAVGGAEAVAQAVPE